MQSDKELERKLVTMRLTKATRDALQAKAKKLGTSQANAIGVALGVTPESAYVSTDKRGKLITR